MPINSHRVASLKRQKRGSKKTHVLCSGVICWTVLNTTRDLFNFPTNICSNWKIDSEQIMISLWYQISFKLGSWILLGILLQELFFSVIDFSTSHWMTIEELCWSIDLSVHPSNTSIHPFFHPSIFLYPPIGSEMGKVFGHVHCKNYYFIYVGWMNFAIEMS